MVAWLMVSLKTQTLGPKAATFAPGQIDESALRRRWDGAAANPAPAARAATTMTGRRSQRAVIPLVIVFHSALPSLLSPYYGRPPKVFQDSLAIPW